MSAEADAATPKSSPWAPALNVLKALRPGSDGFYLLLGAAGLALAIVGAVGAPRLDLTQNPAAVVDGVPIPRAALARAVAALEADSRNEVTADRQAAALERLIEEELLVQHGVALGLSETDFGARRAIVQSVLALALAERAGAAPSEETLRGFYRENAGYFAGTGRYSASVVFVQGSADARERAQAARRALLAGQSAQGLGDELAVPLPTGPRSRNEWRTLLGAAAADAAAALQPGQVSEPIAAQGGFFVVRLDGFVAAPAPPYEEITQQVRDEWDRREGEAAVRAYIERLKRQARIERRL
ncbi:MAG: peptidyl-prolyl cis-trans isomerase [Hyphomonadaceae bacterium]